MGQCKVTYLDSSGRDPQDIDADGYYQDQSRFDFYKDSAAGETKVHSLHGAGVERIENLVERAKATDAGTYRITYHADRDDEDVRADGHNTNGDWVDFYRDSMVGEKIVLSLRKSLVKHIEQI